MSSALLKKSASCPQMLQFMCISSFLCIVIAETMRAMFTAKPSPFEAIYAVIASNMALSVS